MKTHCRHNNAREFMMARSRHVIIYAHCHAAFFHYCCRHFHAYFSRCLTRSCWYFFACFRCYCRCRCRHFSSLSLMLFSFSYYYAAATLLIFRHAAAIDGIRHYYATCRHYAMPWYYADILPGWYFGWYMRHIFSLTTSRSPADAAATLRWCLRYHCSSAAILMLLITLRFMPFAMLLTRLRFWWWWLFASLFSLLLLRYAITLLRYCHTCCWLLLRHCWYFLPPWYAAILRHYYFATPLLSCRYALLSYCLLLIAAIFLLLPLLRDIMICHAATYMLLTLVAMLRHISPSLQYHHIRRRCCLRYFIFAATRKLLIYAIRCFITLLMLFSPRW